MQAAQIAALRNQPAKPAAVPGQNLNTPALWQNNPEGYQIYLQQSNQAAQLRAQSQLAVNRINKVATSTGGHGITPAQAQALQARAQQTRYITSQGLQANKPIQPEIISEPVSAYNARYGFASRPAAGEARLFYEIEPAPIVKPAATLPTQKGPQYYGRAPWASSYKPPEPNLRGGANPFNSPLARGLTELWNNKTLDIGARYDTFQKDISKRLDPYIPKDIEARASYDFRKGIFGPFLPKNTVVEVPIGLDYKGGYSTAQLYPQPGKGQSEIMGNILLAGEMKGWHEKPVDTALLTAATFMLPEIGTLAKNAVKYSPRLSKIAAQEIVFKEGGWLSRATGRTSVPGVGKILIGEIETAAPHATQFVKAPAIKIMGKEAIPAFAEAALAFKGSGRFINVPITVAELGIGVSWGQSALERITGTQEQRVVGTKTFTTPGSTRSWMEGGATLSETISPRTTTETQYETVNIPAIPASVKWNVDRTKGRLGFQWGANLAKMPEGKKMALTSGEIIGTEILPAAFGMVAGDYAWTKFNTWAKTRNALFIPLEPTRSAPTPARYYEQDIIANRQQMRDIFVSNPTGKNTPQIGMLPYETVGKEPSLFGRIVEQFELPFAKRTIRKNIQTSGRLAENQDLVIPGFERVIGPMGEGVATEFQFVQAKGKEENLRNAISLAFKKENPQKARVWEEMWQAIDVANKLDIKPREIDVATLFNRAPNLGGQGATVAAGLRGTAAQPTILYGGTSTHLYYDFVKPIKDIDAVASFPGMRARYITEKTGWKDQFNLVIPEENLRNPKGAAQVDILNPMGREVEVLDIHAPHTYKGKIEYGYKPAPPIKLEEGISTISYGEQFANTLLRSNVVGVSPSRKLTLTTKPSGVKANVDALVGVLDLERKTGMDFPALKQEYLNRIARMPEGIKKKEIYPRARDYGLDIRQIERDYLGGRRTEPGETRFNMGLDFSTEKPQRVKEFTAKIGAKEAIVPGGLGYAGPGYPTNPKVVLGDNLMKSFEGKTLIPAPTKLSGTRRGQSSEIPYVPTYAALPGELPETKAMWTGWEGDVGPVGFEFPLARGESEISGIYGAPVVEAHFTKAGMGGTSSNIRLFGFGFPRAREPVIIRTEGKGFRYLPPEVTAAAEEKNFAYVNNWMEQNAEPGIMYLPRFKKEYEGVLPAFNREGNVNLQVAARDYYTVVNGVRVPIVKVDIAETTPWAKIIGGQPTKIGFTQKRGGGVGWLSESDVIGRMHTQDAAAARNIFRVGSLVKGMRTKSEGPINFSLVKSVGPKNASKVEATLIKYKATVAGSTARTGQISPGRLREYKGRPADLDLTAKDFHGLANQLAKDMGGRVQKKRFNLQVTVRGKPVADVNPAGRRQSNPFGWKPTEYVTTPQGYKYDTLSTQVQRYTYNEYNTLLGRGRVPKGEFKAEFGRKTKDTQRLFTDVQTLLMESEDARKTREIAMAMREARKHPEIRKVVGNKKYVYGSGKDDFFSGVPMGESYINRPGQISLINPTVLGTNAMLIPKRGISATSTKGGGISRVSTKREMPSIGSRDYSMETPAYKVSERSSIPSGVSSTIGGSSGAIGRSSISTRSSFGRSSSGRISQGSSISRGDSSIYGGGSSISRGSLSRTGRGSSISGGSSSVFGGSSIYGGGSSISGGQSSGYYPPGTPPGTPPHTPPGTPPPLTPPPTTTKPPWVPISTTIWTPILEVKRGVKRRKRRGVTVSQWNIKNPVPRIATLFEPIRFTYRKDWAPTNLKIASKKVIVESFPGTKEFIMKRM